jgi:hypothetical protein
MYPITKPIEERDPYIVSCNKQYLSFFLRRKFIANPRIDLETI